MSYLGMLLILWREHGHIKLHGDMYKHGKECDKPIDEGDEGCYKKIKANGELSVFGLQRNVNKV